MDEKTSKWVKRKMAKFKKGDIVEYKAEPYVVKVMGKEVMLQHAKNGQKVHVKLKDIGLIKIRKAEAED